MPSEKPYYIIGTAGHIDHGKTSLIKALTGIDTDRLKEEKERGITIDLGFAYFTGSDGRKYGIVDVPGHEKFIPNMLAGAYGFDVVIMVVAADDGVKPQTIEHFEILHLLRVPKAMFVITKTDLASPDRIEEVREEINILIHGSYLEGSNIIPVSNITGDGLPEVAKEISRLVGEEIPIVKHAYFRFPIDRAFTITGFGTVVTGTIVSGEVKLDDEVVLIPDGKRLRVRNIEVHEEKVDKAVDGQRAAINLTKIEKEEIQRGMELVDLELSTETYYRYFAFLEMLPHKYCNLKNFSRVRLFKGTMETMATIVNLEDKPFSPKGKYVVQLNLQVNSLILSGERFIIRDETNRFTIGGGEFLIPATIKRTKINDEYLIKLKSFVPAELSEKLSTALLFSRRIIMPLASLSTMFNLTNAEILTAIKNRGSDFEILNLREKSIALRERLSKAKELILDLISSYHTTHPEFPGIPKKDVREKLHDQFYNDEETEIVWELLIEEGRVIDLGEFLQMKGFRIEFKGEDSEIKSKIIDIYSDISGNTPKKERLPEILNTSEEKINRIFQGLIKSKELIMLQPALYISRAAFENAENKAVEFIKQKGELAVAEFRDMIGTNRNMAVAILEALDNKGVTIRKGNIRVLKRMTQ